MDLSLSPSLLHDRARPDFRDRYGELAQSAVTIEAAVGRVRLLGVTLRPTELERVERIRVVLQEVSPLAAATEAEQLAADPRRRPRLEQWARLIREGRLELRLAPLAGWSPDFSVFHGPPPSPPIVLIGPHWFLRPYPHPGPAFNALLRGEAARIASVRFNEIWRGAHDLRGPMLRILESASRAEGVPAGWARDPMPPASVGP